MRGHPDSNIKLQAAARPVAGKRRRQGLPNDDAPRQPPSADPWTDLLAGIYAEALAGPSLGADAVDIVRRLRDGDLN